MNYHIHIQELALEAWVGIHPHEQRFQPIVINLTLTVSANLGYDYDAMEHTLNYEEVVGGIKDLLAREKFQLLETLAISIADLALNYPQTEGVEVTAGKPGLLGSQQISVTIKKNKEKNPAKNQGH